MSGFDVQPRQSSPPPPGEGQSRIVLVAQIVGLAATAGVVWFTTVAPRLHRYTWTSLVLNALGYALFAWLWSALITFCVYLTVPQRDRGDVVWATIRGATVAVWFAPAILLLSQLSPLALPAALVLIVSATRMLYAEWRRIREEDGDFVPEETPPPGLFGENLPPTRMILSELAPALGIAISLQLAVSAILLHVPLLGGVLLAATSALLTIFAIRTGASEPLRTARLPRSILGAVLTVLLAAGVTVGGLSGRVITRPRFSGGSDTPPSRSMVDSARALLRQLFYGDQPPETKDADKQWTAKDEELARAAAVAAGGNYAGVILTSETRPVPLLVAPVSARNALFGQQPQSYTIPFGGEYWMYRARYHRPPSDSYRRSGSPSALSFSTTDHWPLVMEAHQSLDEPLDLDCCRAIRVDIWNADRYPGTVRLELTAQFKDSAGFTHVMPLGVQPVRSVPDLSKQAVTPVPEQLEFTVPADPLLSQCNDLKVVFGRDPQRMDKSARIAIERFVLIPR